MKYIIALLFISLITLTSCKKFPTSKTAEIRYEFNTNIADQYAIIYAEKNNGIITSESFTGTSWFKTVNMTLNTGILSHNEARLALYPPSSWANTSKSANVVFKTYINNILKNSLDTVLKASDTNGIWTDTIF